MVKPKSESGKVFPWFRIFASDFLSETGELTPSETGIFIKLLAVMHLHAEPIVDDIGRLARRVGADIRVFKPARTALIEAGLIILKDGKLWSALSEGELEHITARSQIARSNVATRHQKSKQKQSSISTDVDKTRAVIRTEKLDAQSPTETEQSLTSHSSDRFTNKDRAEAARASAAPRNPKVASKVYLAGIGHGWVEKIVCRTPLITVIIVRDDDGLSTPYRVVHEPDGRLSPTEITMAQSDALRHQPEEIDHDRSA